MELRDLSAFIDIIREHVTNEFFEDGVVSITSSEAWILENLKEIFDSSALSAEINESVLTVKVA